jgi:hypothetical protein
MKSYKVTHQKFGAGEVFGHNWHSVLGDAESQKSQVADLIESGVEPDQAVVRFENPDVLETVPFGELRIGGGSV